MPARRAVAALLVSAFPALPTTAAVADLWDDRPLKVVQTVEVNFPAALSQRGVLQGEVRAVLHVDADGALLDSFIVGYTHSELAAELLASLRHWRFEPARNRGQAVAARASVAFRFESRGSVVSLTAADAMTSGVNRLIATPMTSLLCRLPELDQPPALVHVIQPLHPGSALPPQRGGRASVDFYIDGEGRPRMPVVTRASHDAFGAAALAAVMQWRFAPPTRHGQPVLVRVVQDFVFPDRT